MTKASKTICEHVLCSKKKMDTFTLLTHMRSRTETVKKNDLSLSDKSTNRGLISEDRSTEATLLFTIPRSCLSRLHRIYL